jgi:hypothetical protein
VQPNTLDLLGFALLHPTYQIYPTTTSSNTIVMKLIQISPCQLICEDDTYRQYIMEGVAIFVLGIIVLCGITIWEIYEGFGLFFLIPLLAFVPILLGLINPYTKYSHYTATIDLDLECIEIKQYWLLSRKRRIQQYPIALITRIEVKDDDNRDYENDTYHNYQVVWRHHNDSVVMFGGCYTSDRSRAEADAEIIRSFLNQDGRDIEIG